MVRFVAFILLRFGGPWGVILVSLCSILVAFGAPGQGSGPFGSFWVLGSIFEVSGLQNRSTFTLLKALYTNAQAIFRQGDNTYIIIRYLSGVLQGCPASGWLFNSAIDPFLHAFSSALKPNGIGMVRACADDLSFALSRMKHLSLLYPIYTLAEKIAGLTLHPQKCVIIPLIKRDEYKYDQIKRWLSKNIPEWQNMQITDAAKLLGFFLGPGCGKLNWRDPVIKLVKRVSEIKSATAPIQVNAYDYNARVSTVLSYQAQLLPIDKRHFMWERVALHTVFRAPWNSFRHQDFFALQHIGGPTLRSLPIACTSAIFRTAVRTATSWPMWISQMKLAAQEHLSVTRGIKDLDYPECWDSPSFAHNLKWAFDGFPGQPRLELAGSQVRQCFIDKNGGRPLFPGDDFFSSAGGIQKLVYRAIMDNVFPDVQCDQLSMLCAARCAALFKPYDIFAGDGPNFPEAFEILEGVGGHISLKVVKTWLNGWATSHRMHEDVVHDCLLGCQGAADSLNHYVVCPHMFAMLRYLFISVSDDPLIRLGIKSPEVFSLQVLSCLFSAYHALKSKVRGGRINLHSVSWLNDAWSVFAEVLKAEAGDLRLSSRSFSLPKFINFLVTGRVPDLPGNSAAIQDHH